MTTTDRLDLRIDTDRLWSRLMELGQIGGTEKGGVCRIAPRLRSAWLHGESEGKGPILS